MKYNHFLLASFCTIFLFYACTYDEWWEEDSELSNDLTFGKNRELTIQAAKSWYAANNAPVTRMATTDLNSLGFLVSPSWNHAKEWKKGEYEVVEASLRSNVDVLFLDKETEAKKTELSSEERRKIMNVGRTVILKNITTGEIITFNMVIIGSHQYLMQNDNNLSDNTYLYRSLNFDGTILFFHPDGQFVNGWRYENGKITGEISPAIKIEEDELEEETVIGTRSGSDVECHMEDIPYTYFHCPSTRTRGTFLDDWMGYYGDGEFGGDGGSGGNGWWDNDPNQKFPLPEVEIPSDCYWMTVNLPTFVCVPVNGSSGGGGYGGGGNNPSSIAPKAMAIFRNTTMIEQNWKVIERMIDKIMEDCMGAGLYNGLKSKLNGNTLVIELAEGNEASFNLQNSTMRLGMDLLESNVLLHEMMHALQAYYETMSSYREALLNIEIEAHYAQYLYLKNRPEYKKSGNKWEKQYNSHQRLIAIKNIEKYVNNKGDLIEDADILDTFLDYSVVEAFRRDDGYKNFSYNYSRNGISNFSVLNSITQNCN